MSTVDIVINGTDNASGALKGVGTSVDELKTKTGQLQTATEGLTLRDAVTGISNIALEQ